MEEKLKRLKLSSNPADNINIVTGVVLEILEIREKYIIDISQQLLDMKSKLDKDKGVELDFLNLQHHSSEFANPSIKLFSNIINNFQEMEMTLRDSHNHSISNSNPDSVRRLKREIVSNM